MRLVSTEGISSFLTKLVTKVFTSDQQTSLVSNTSLNITNPCIPIKQCIRKSKSFRLQKVSTIQPFLINLVIVHIEIGFFKTN